MKPTLPFLQQQAIKAAKDLNWEEAIRINEEILTLNERDVAALNRLGLAHLQLQKPKKAAEIFNSVLAIDKCNIIAQKHIKNLREKNGSTQLLSFTGTNTFIEEPGKARIIELHRLAGKQVLYLLSIGQSCKLVPKNRFISVETEDGVYIGALPEDLSFRLTKLITRGNTYACLIYSRNEKQCSIHLAEDEVAKRNEHLPSFPPKKIGTGAQLQDDFVPDEEVFFGGTSDSEENEADAEDDGSELDEQPKDLEE